jgi:hypothetical protein
MAIVYTTGEPGCRQYTLYSHAKTCRKNRLPWFTPVRRSVFASVLAPEKAPGDPGPDLKNQESANSKCEIVQSTH